MKGLLFDSSSHLGQFCVDSEVTRIGCKNMQVSLVGGHSTDKVGAWTDLENGRVDRSIWSIPEKMQAAYYPVMDRFFSVASIDQTQITPDTEQIVWQLRSVLPQLSLYGRLNLATAIVQERSRIYTLFSEMFDSSVRAYVEGEYGINIIYPSAEEEIPYSDPQLETYYQKALAEFRVNEMNLLTSMEDERLVQRK